MIVSDNPAKETLSIQEVSDGAKVRTVVLWGSERRHAGYFE